MSEIKVYQDEKDVKFATGKPAYAFGDKVKPGQVLRVTQLSGTFDNVATTEYIELGFWNGHAYVQLYKGAPAVAGDWVHYKCHVYLREEQYVYAYCADVADGAVMKLRAHGRFM